MHNNKVFRYALSDLSSRGSTQNEKPHRTKNIHFGCVASFCTGEESWRSNNRSSSTITAVTVNISTKNIPTDKFNCEKVSFEHCFACQLVEWRWWLVCVYVRWIPGSVQTYHTNTPIHSLTLTVSHSVSRTSPVPLVEVAIRVSSSAKCLKHPTACRA